MSQTNKNNDVSASIKYRVTISIKFSVSIRIIKMMLYITKTEEVPVKRPPRRRHISANIKVNIVRLF